MGRRLDPPDGRRVDPQIWYVRAYDWQAPKPTRMRNFAYLVGPNRNVLMVEPLIQGQETEFHDMIEAVMQWYKRRVAVAR